MLLKSRESSNWLTYDAFSSSVAVQVKAAHQLLKTITHSYGSRRVDGVPVLSKKNSDIAIATKDGIKWCIDSLVSKFKYAYLNFQGIGLSFFFPYSIPVCILVIFNYFSGHRTAFFFFPYSIPVCI
ncbi:hypothetical protein NC652_027608 [Populus alba x Populus x berolinensis]|nr:hypothetical protein NC652_027608 [Populus alba x Populus x berolinensis]